VQQVRLTDRHLARIVKSCQDVPGQILFQYLDATGERQTIGSADVNAYLREIAGEAFSATDFRTWSGTVLAMQALAAMEAPATKAAARRSISAAIHSVARRLGNTAIVCRKCYVHPAVLKAYRAGALQGVYQPRPVDGLTADEALLLGVLERDARDAAPRLAVPPRDLESALRRSVRPPQASPGG
jgi:DNA topoisomerase-1